MRDHGFCFNFELYAGAQVYILHRYVTINYQLIYQVIQINIFVSPFFLFSCLKPNLYGWEGSVARIFTCVHTTVYEVEKTAAKTVNSFVLVDN